MDSDSSSNLDGDVYLNPEAEKVDLSNIRGIKNKSGKDDEVGSETDLENLAELLPGIKNRRGSHETDVSQQRQSGGGRLHDSGHLLLDDSGDVGGDRTTRSDDFYDIKGEQT